MLISMWRYNWFNPRTTQYQKICMTNDMCYIVGHASGLGKCLQPKTFIPGFLKAHLNYIRIDTQSSSSDPLTLKNPLVRVLQGHIGPRWKYDPFPSCDETNSNHKKYYTMLIL